MESDLNFNEEPTRKNMDREYVPHPNILENSLAGSLIATFNIYERFNISTVAKDVIFDRNCSGISARVMHVDRYSLPNKSNKCSG